MLVSQDCPYLRTGRTFGNNGRMVICRKYERCD
nr:MAG TPA: hypothetical protein [Caudoviricetes sp.]